MNRLEEVLVITKKEDRAPSIAETGRVRAVDILTQRLPSVPDKPAVGAAGGAANATAPAAGNASANSPSANAPSTTTPSASKPANKGTVKPVTPADAVPAPKKAPEPPAANPPQVKSGPSGDQPH
jgi:hypothetical protein